MCPEQIMEDDNIYRRSEEDWENGDISEVVDEYQVTPRDVDHGHNRPQEHIKQ